MRDGTLTLYCLSIARAMIAIVRDERNASGNSQEQGMMEAKPDGTESCPKEIRATSGYAWR